MAEPMKTNATRPPGPAMPEAPLPPPAKPAADPALTSQVEALKNELAEMKDREKRLNIAIRKLAASILTPAGVSDKGQGRRNAIAIAIQELVKEFEFKEE